MLSRPHRQTRMHRHQGWRSATIKPHTRRRVTVHSVIHALSVPLTQDLRAPIDFFANLAPVPVFRKRSRARSLPPSAIHTTRAPVSTFVLALDVHVPMWLAADGSDPWTLVNQRQRCVVCFDPALTRPFLPRWSSRVSTLSACIQSSRIFVESDTSHDDTPKGCR